MKKVVILYSLFLFLLTFLVSPSLAEVFDDFNNQDVLTDAEKALDEYVSFIVKNVNRPYYLLSEEEKERLTVLYRKIMERRKELYEVHKIPYSTFDWLTPTGVPSNPVVKVKPEKFTLIETTSHVGSLVLKKIYGDSISVMVYYFPLKKMASPKEIEEKAEKEKDKYFCLFNLMSDVISCPSFHLERSLFGKEMVEDCWKSGGSNCSPVQVPVWSYEKLRRMLFWLEKEFGPKGRNLVPSVLESRDSI